MGPSDNTPAAIVPFSQPSKQASGRREEDVGDAIHAAREALSVATVVDLGSESESGRDSSEHLDDERHSDDESRSDTEEYLNDESLESEEDEEGEESEQSTSNHAHDELSWLSADDLDNDDVVDEIINFLNRPRIFLRDIYKRAQWTDARELLDDIYDLLNATLHVSAADGITHEKVAKQDGGTRRLFVRAFRKMHREDRPYFTKLWREVWACLK